MFNPLPPCKQTAYSHIAIIFSSIDIQMLKEDSTVVTGELIKIRFSTVDFNYEDINSFVLKLDFAKSVKHPIWLNYPFPEIRVGNFSICRLCLK